MSGPFCLSDAQLVRLQTFSPTSVDIEQDAANAAFATRKSAFP